MISPGSRPLTGSLGDPFGAGGQGETGKNTYKAP